MPSYKITFSSALDNYSHQLNEGLEFSESESAALKRFSSDVRKLAGFKIFKEGGPGAIRFSYNKVDGEQISAGQIDFEAWAAAMHLLAQPTSFVSCRRLVARTDPPWHGQSSKYSAKS